MKKKRFPTKIEIANLVVMVMGIAMILCSSIFTVDQETSSVMLVIIGNLGIGIFPTGIIGFTLERIQNRSKEKEKRNKRLAILRLFNNAVHNYLNVICNSAIQINNNLKNKKVSDIISTVTNEKVKINISKEERDALALLSKRLQQSFGATNPLYIVADVFEEIEITHFEMLLKCGNELLRSMNKKDIIVMRNSFLSYLQTTYLTISECSYFNEMISNGDNIFIPD